MIANYTTAVTSSTAITFSLFYVMQALIAMQPGVLVEPNVHRLQIWNLPPRVEEPPMIEEMPRRIDDVVPPPLTNPVDLNNDGFEKIAVHYSPPQPTGPGHIPVNMAISDGPLVNIVRVRPMYPSSAAANGREGYVVVQFDVLASGQVANVSIVDSSHRVFEREAVRAASRFRYKPRVVDGIAIETKGIRYRFKFEMEK